MNVNETIIDGSVEYQLRESASTLNTENLSYGIIPVGFITPFLQSTAPDGWLSCNGAEVNRATYPDLWNFINNSSQLISEFDWQNKNNTGNKNIGWFSNGNGTTTFRLPRIIGSGELTESIMFSTPGENSFVAPVTGIYKITLQGGGGGGSKAVGNFSGNGGGAGGYLEFYENLIKDTTYSFTVGEGGAGGDESRADGYYGTETTITINNNIYSATSGQPGWRPQTYSSGSSGNCGLGKINNKTVTASYGGEMGLWCDDNAISLRSSRGGGHGTYNENKAIFGGGGHGGRLTSSSGTRTAENGGDGGDGYIKFEYNPIPQYWYVRAFGSATNQGTIDITALANLVNTKLDTTTFENIFPVSSESHSRIFRGKEIMESWASLRERIAQGNFADLYIGDYKIITLTTGETVVMEIAGIDQYYNCGDTVIGHHVDFISRDCLASTERMNATNTNNGTADEKHPWLASKLYQTLNDESTGVYSTLPTDLKSYIITKRALLEERYSSDGAVSADTGCSWANAGKLWLPTEVEVFGHYTRSEPGYGTGGGGYNLQYPIFYGGAKHIIKGNGNGGARCTWWELSTFQMNAMQFCNVSSSGTANATNASNTSLHTPLCFRIG